MKLKCLVATLVFLLASVSPAGASSSSASRCTTGVIGGWNTRVCDYYIYTNDKLYKEVTAKVEYPQGSENFKIIFSADIPYNSQNTGGYTISACSGNPASMYINVQGANVYTIKIIKSDQWNLYYVYRQDTGVFAWFWVLGGWISPSVVSNWQGGGQVTITLQAFLNEYEITRC